MRTRVTAVLVGLVLVLAAAACEPPPDPWWPTVRTDDVAMLPGYDAVVGDLDGDGYDDILWYDGGVDSDTGTTKADHPESMWLGRADGHFARVPAPAQVHGHYRPIVMQLDGTGPEDIIWYSSKGASPGWVMAPGGTIAERWTTQLARRAEVFLIDNTGRPDDLGFRLGGGGEDGIVVWRATQYPDEIWLSVIEGAARAHPIAGDFDGDGWGDVFLYRPGSGADAIAWHASNSEPTANVQGHYNPVAADTDGDGRDDIVFVHESTEDTTRVWRSGPSRTFRSRSYQPIGERFLVPVQRATVPGGRDAIPLWHVAPDLGPLVWWVHPDDSSGNQWTGIEPIGSGNVSFVLGHFSDGIREDVLIYDQIEIGIAEQLLLSPRATA
jgi:hypothetical protein